MTPWYASAYTGLLTRFGAIAPRPHDPPLPAWSGEAPAWLPGGPLVNASGIGWDEETAEAACVGETIERLQATPLPEDGLLQARHDAWPRSEPAVDPAQWVLFQDEQYRQADFPFEPLTPATLCDWICCRRALTGTAWWVPADLVYLHLPAGHRFCPGVSTGLACGRVGDPVVLRGLQEVIERDAVIGAWWRLYALEEYAASAVLGAVCAAAAELFVRPALSYRCFRIVSPFSANVTMVTVEGQDREGYCFSVGSACRETLLSSWRKSLLEAIHGRHYVRHLKAQVAAATWHVGPCPRDFAEHAVYYSLHPERLRHTVLGRTYPTRAVLPAELQHEADETTVQLVERLGADRPVLVRSMTPAALATAQLGWHTVRVVVPSLRPLHGNHAWPHLGGCPGSAALLADRHDLPPHAFP
jgi:ribosomal protein S12 methylthiotransferase accessory factor